MVTRNFRNVLQKYFWPDRAELRSFIIVIFILALIISFDNWGYGDIFDAYIGMNNFALAVLLVFVSVGIHHAAQRVVGIYYGYRVEQRLWWYGILLGIILAIFSQGKWLFLAATGTFIHQVPIQKLGRHPFNPDIERYTTVCLAGPLANILLAGFIKTLNVWFGLTADFITPIFNFNMLYAIYSLLPIPPLDGSRVFFNSRLTYAFIMGTIVSYFFLIIFLHIYSYIFALVFGGIVWLTFYIMFEREWI